MEVLQALAVLDVLQVCEVWEVLEVLEVLGFVPTVTVACVPTADRSILTLFLLPSRHSHLDALLHSLLTCTLMFWFLMR